jgi:hypothetical protein
MPYQSLGEKGWRAGFDDGMEPLGYGAPKLRCTRSALGQLRRRGGPGPLASDEPGQAKLAHEPAGAPAQS